MTTAISTRLNENASGSLRQRFPKGMDLTNAQQNRLSHMDFRRPSQFAFYALTLLSAALASTSGHSTELQSAFGNSNCIVAPDTQIAAGTNPFSVAARDLNDDDVMDMSLCRPPLISRCGPAALTVACNSLVTKIF